MLIAMFQILKYTNMFEDEQIAHQFLFESLIC